MPLDFVLRVPGKRSDNGTVATSGVLRFVADHGEKDEHYREDH